MRAGSGVWALLRMQWRTTWLWLLLSPALLAALVVAIASGVKDLYGEETERTIYAETMGASPDLWALRFSRWPSRSHRPFRHRCTFGHQRSAPH